MMFILVFSLGFALAPQAGAGDKPNVIIQTDIHPTDGEPDDKQSLIRFLLEANEFNVLGLIATDRTPELNQQSLDRIREVIDAYEKVYPNLVKHASGYPTADYLRSVVIFRRGATDHPSGGRGPRPRLDRCLGGERRPWGRLFDGFKRRGPRTISMPS